jgi:hypothetical protein
MRNWVGKLSESFGFLLGQIACPRVEEFGCENASLTGDCSNEILSEKAACEVTGCELQPACPTPAI